MELEQDINYNEVGTDRIDQLRLYGTADLRECHKRLIERVAGIQMKGGEGCVGYSTNVFDEKAAGPVISIDNKTTLVIEEDDVYGKLDFLPFAATTKDPHDAIYGMYLGIRDLQLVIEKQLDIGFVPHIVVGETNLQLARLACNKIGFSAYIVCGEKGGLAKIKRKLGIGDVDEEHSERLSSDRAYELFSDNKVSSGYSVKIAIPGESLFSEATTEKLERTRKMLAKRLRKEMKNNSISDDDLEKEVRILAIQKCLEYE